MSHNEEEDLFLEDDESIGYELTYDHEGNENFPNKRQKIDSEEKKEVQFTKSLDTANIGEPDSDFSDWEDVISATQETSFNIKITDEDPELVKQEQIRKEKLKELIKGKQIRLSIHHLSIVSYMTSLKMRNKLLNSKAVQKKLKKLLPESLMSNKIKKFKSLSKKYDDATISNNREDFKQLDELLVYILKYLIKWFRLNYKLDCNGLRVLGYLPSKADPQDYFPNNSSDIHTRSDLLLTIKNFRHNRDTGAQIFTSLLRSIGFDARLVMSLPLLSTSRHTKCQSKLDHDRLKRTKDDDLLYPYYWTELINPINKSEIFIIETICFHDENKRLMRLSRHPKSNGKGAFSLDDYFTSAYSPKPDQLNQMPPMQYVMALDNDGLMTDVSSRYLSDISYRYFNKLDLRTESGRTALLVQSLLRYSNKALIYDESTNFELNCLRMIALKNYSTSSTFSSMKKNPNLVTHSTLRYNEIIDPSAKKITTVNISKNKLKEFVYFKNSITVGKSEQQWKFLGRSIIPTQRDNPIKKTNALQPRTIFKKRLFNFNAENNLTNEVNLYSFDQTCQYIKENIFVTSDGDYKLPRNKYGNIEIFRDSMIPDDCYWLKLSDANKIFREYKRNPSDFEISEELEFVPVVVGFDFKSKLGHAIPTINGVLVLKLKEIIAKKIWLQGKIRHHKLQQESKKFQSLKFWNFFLKKLRIQKRLEKYDT